MKSKLYVFFVIITFPIFFMGNILLLGVAAVVDFFERIYQSVK